MDQFRCACFPLAKAHFPAGLRASARLLRVFKQPQPIPCLKGIAMPFLRHLALLSLVIAPLAANAQAESGVHIELNATDTIGESCRLTFLLTNSLDQDVDKIVAETVLFSDQKQVVLLTLFDFAALPAGRPRVRQFQVPNVSCDRLSQVLVNGISTCTQGGEQSTACQDTLRLSSRVDIELEG